jgi:hypothetical protein
MNYLLYDLENINKTIMIFIPKNINFVVVVKTFAYNSLAIILFYQYLFAYLILSNF